MEGQEAAVLGKTSKFRDANTTRNKQSIAKLECRYFQTGKGFVCTCACMCYVCTYLCVLQRPEVNISGQQSGAECSQLCVCVCSHMCGCMLHVLKCVGRLIGGVFLGPSLPCLLRQGLSTKLASPPVSLANFPERSLASAFWVLRSQMDCCAYLTFTWVPMIQTAVLPLTSKMFTHRAISPHLLSLHRVSFWPDTYQFGFTDWLLNSGDLPNSSSPVLEFQVHPTVPGLWNMDSEY